MNHLGTLIGLALLASVAAAAPACAQEIPEAQRLEAQGHFERGTEAYERGDYTEAEAEFRAAHGLTQHPDLLYNVYTAAERGGRLPQAVEALAGYLEAGELTESRRDSLSVRLERLRLRMEQEAMAAQQEAQRVEEQRQATAQQAAQRAVQEASELNAAQSQADARRAAAAQAAGTADALQLTGIVALAAGGAALVSFAVFAGLSQTEADELRVECQAFGCTAERTAALSSFNLGADVSWISGAGLLALGLGLVLGAEAAREPGADEAWLVPAVGPTFVGASAGGGF